MWLAVGRVGKPHGVRGELTVEVRTDEPERRFRPGAVLTVLPPSPTTARGEPQATLPSTVEVESVRWHQERLLLRLVGVTDRTDAEGWRGVVLQVAVDPTETPEDPEEFYDHQLEGLVVVDLEGAVIGAVEEVQHPGVQDLLAVRTPEGRLALVPFVAALVPEVDLTAGRVVVADRPGLVAPFED
ncbi:ribosome maturation factor RimM [Nocardioidaceae bacterium]|nr:ribosome maturation factor RimM [Nocardioidaceae bacterium]